MYSEDINYDKDKPIQYGSVGKALTEGVLNLIKL